MIENTSGSGKDSVVPPELDKWNWGAFFLSWIWGIGNNTYRAFLVFIPLFGFFFLFALGFKGSSWAWKHKKWESVEHFQRVQRKWTIAALIFLAVIAIAFIATFYFISSSMKSSAAYESSVSLASSDPKTIETIGVPFKTGIVMGSLNRSSTDGQASINYKITGPIGTGRVYTDATMKRGIWKTDCLEIQLPDNSRSVVVPCK